MTVVDRDMGSTIIILNDKKILLTNLNEGKLYPSVFLVDIIKFLQDLIHKNRVNIITNVCS